MGFCSYSLLPCILLSLYQSRDDSWAKVVAAYGVLLTALQVGKSIGWALADLGHKSRCLFAFVFGSLVVAYNGLCFSRRYSVILFFYTVVGVCSSFIIHAAAKGDRTITNFLAHDIVSMWRKPTDSIADDSKGNIARNNERAIMLFTFSALLTGILYDDRPSSTFPMLFLSLFVNISVLLFALYFIFMKRLVRQRVKAAVGSGKLNPETSISEKSTRSAKSDAFISYDGPVPANFLSACGGNVSNAQKMYAKCLEWRQENNLDELLETPQTGFHSILKYYPHAIHGYSLDGCVVVYEVLGKAKSRELTASVDSVDTVVWHFVLRNEYIFQKLLDPKKVETVLHTFYETGVEIPALPEIGKMMTVIDVAGISVSSVTADVISFIKKSSEIVDSYYPDRVKRLVICNAPRWFFTIWSVIARVLPESVQKKIDILYDCKGLDKYIHPSQRPREYGGTDVDLGESEAHKGFLRLADNWESELKLQRSEEGRVIARQGLNTGNTMNSTKSASLVPTSNKNSSMSNTSSADNNINGNSSSGGVLGWWKNKFRKVPAAYLGETNKYEYNATTGGWKLANTESRHELSGENIQRDASHGSTNGRRYLSNEGSASGFSSTDSYRNISDLSADQLEEHGLVLAIQAAHLASSYGSYMHSPISNMNTQYRKQKTSGGLALSEQGDGSGISRTNSTDQDLQVDWNNDSDTDASTDDSNGQTVRDRKRIALSKISSRIFLLVTSMHFLSCLVQAFLVTLLPVWMASDVRSGGLHYGVEDIAIVLSTAGLIALHFHRFFQAKLVDMLRASPLRALRISCGVLVSLLYIVTFTKSGIQYSVDEDGIVPILLSHSRHLLAHKLRVHRSGSVLDLSGRTGIDDELPLEHWELKHANYHKQRGPNGMGPVFPSATTDNLLLFTAGEDAQPHQAFLSVIIPALLIAVLMCASHIVRKSTAILLHLSLSSSFTSPSAVRMAINGFCDVLGPLLAAILYGNIYSLKLTYPMDASFFLSLSACLVMLVYMASVLLKVQFRGDYGVMTDDDEQRVEGASTGNRHSRNTPKEQESSMIGEIVSVPASDMKLLFTKIGGGYGSKLYNLKDDFKDL